jgi:hypothetical protein
MLVKHLLILGPLHLWFAYASGFLLKPADEACHSLSCHMTQNLPCQWRNPFFSSANFSTFSTSYMEISAPLATWKSPLDYIKISASNRSHSPSDRTHRARIVFI